MPKYLLIALALVVAPTIIIKGLAIFIGVNDQPETMTSAFWLGNIIGWFCLLGFVLYLIEQRKGR